MLAYTTIGTNDWDKATAFYDALFSSIGAKPVFKTDRFRGYGRSPKDPFFAVCKPFDGQAATSGNGTMITLGCDSPDQVKALYAKALELGATDDGEPGGRAGGAFYLAYVRDLDGNKLAFFAPPARS